MAKYKQPKNEKHKARKDLKDYTIDKDVQGMVPNASGEIMPDVPRKDDKEMIDDVENMVPNIKDSDRVYVTKQMEDGDPKRPANSLKVFNKNVEEDAKELIDTLAKKDGGYMSQIKKLTKEQKEKLVREVVKRKVELFLSEQKDTEQADEEGEGQKDLANTPEPPAAPEAPAEPADSTPEAPEAPEAPVAPAAPEAPAEPETPEEAPAAAATDDSEEKPDAEGGDQRISKFITALEEKPNIVQRMKIIMQVINKVTADDDKKRKIGKLSLIKRAIDRAVANIN